MLSHHILMNILSLNYYITLWRKDLVIILHTESFHWAASNISKQEKNMFKLNVFWISFLPYLYTVRIWLNHITSKAFRSSRSQMFYEIGVFENFGKFTGKQLCWNHILKTFKETPSQVLSSYFCEIFKNTYFWIAPQKSKNASALRN